MTNPTGLGTRLLSRSIVLLLSSVAVAGGEEKQIALVNPLMTRDGISIPLAKLTESPMPLDVSIVRAKQTEQKTRSSESRSGRAKMEFQVQEVYCGVDSILGRIFSANVGFPMVGSFNHFGDTRYRPEESEEGIWVVVQRRRQTRGSGKVVPVDMSAVGINLPCFESGCFWPYATSPPSYADTKEFGATLRRFTSVEGGKEKRFADLSSLAKSDNCIIKRWAVWQLCLERRADVKPLLKGICNEVSGDVLTQAIADVVLIQAESGESWQRSNERKRMYSRWLSLPDPEFSWFWNVRLRRVLKQWPTLGYDEATLHRQINAAYDELGRQDGKKRLLLKKALPTVRGLPREIEVTQEE